MNNNIETQIALLEDYAPESVISTNGHFYSFSDDVNYIFTRGTDNLLTVIKQDTNSYSGWKQFDISPPDKEVTSFDVYQDPLTKRVTVVYSIKGTDSSYLYISNPFKLSELSDDLNAKACMKKPIKISGDNISINHLIIANNSVYFSSTENYSDAKYYTLNSESDVIPYALPNNASKIDDIKYGIWDNLPGLFLLYRIGTSQLLIFKSFPDEEFGQSIIIKFKISKEVINSIEVEHTETNSTLIAAGNNISFYTNSTKPSYIFHNSNNTPISIFRAISHNERIHLIYQCDIYDGKPVLLSTSRSKEIDDDWLTPNIIYTDVSNFSLVSMKNSLSAFCVNQEGTTLTCVTKGEFWSSNLVPVASKGKLRRFYSLNAIVDLTNSITDKTDFVLLRSSRDVSVTINGSLYNLSKDSSTKINIQNSTSLEVIYEPGAVLGCLIYINCKEFCSEYCLDMAKPLVDKFATLTEVSSITNDPILGSQLKSEKFKSDGSINNCIEVIKALLIARPKLIDKMNKQDISNEVGLLSISPIVPEAAAVFDIPALPFEVLVAGEVLIGYLFFNQFSDPPAYFEGEVDNTNNELSLKFTVDNLEHTIPIETPDQIPFLCGLMLSQLGISLESIGLWAGHQIAFDEVSSLFESTKKIMKNGIDEFKKNYDTDVLSKLIDNLVVPVIPPDTDIPITPKFPPEEEQEKKTKLFCKNPISNWFLSRLTRYSIPYIIQQIEMHISSNGYSKLADKANEIEKKLEGLDSEFTKIESLIGNELHDISKISAYFSSNNTIELFKPFLHALNNEELVNALPPSSLSVELENIPFLCEIFHQKICKDSKHTNNGISLVDTVILSTSFTATSLAAIDDSVKSKKDEQNNYFSEVNLFGITNAVLVMLRACFTFQRSRLMLLESEGPAFTQLNAKALAFDFLLRAIGTIVNSFPLTQEDKDKSDVFKAFEKAYYFSTFITYNLSFLWATSYALIPRQGVDLIKREKSFRSFVKYARYATGVMGLLNTARMSAKFLLGEKISPVVDFPSAPVLAFQLTAFLDPDPDRVKMRRKTLGAAGLLLFAGNLIDPAIKND